MKVSASTRSAAIGAVLAAAFVAGAMPALAQQGGKRAMFTAIVQATSPAPAAPGSLRSAIGLQQNALANVATGAGLAASMEAIMARSAPVVSLHTTNLRGIATFRGGPPGGLRTLSQAVDAGDRKGTLVWIPAYVGAPPEAATFAPGGMIAGPEQVACAMQPTDADADDAITVMTASESDCEAIGGEVAMMVETADGDGHDHDD